MNRSRRACPSPDAVGDPLPAPETIGGMSLAGALCARRSHRSFVPQRVPVEEVAQLCWAAQGISEHGQGLRTAPSAGALFGVHLLVVRAEGIEAYDPTRHTLRRTVTGDVRAVLAMAAGDQDCVRDAPLCLALAIDEGRLASTYGARAERYCLLEAGHVAQNVLLQATALGLVGVPVGAFDDARVASVLHLAHGLVPVYLIPLGWPRADGRSSGLRSRRARLRSGKAPSHC
jgi:SagB-type dehydrogenase family enzyme